VGGCILRKRIAISVGGESGENKSEIGEEGNGPFLLDDGAMPRKMQEADILRWEGKNRANKKLTGITWEILCNQSRGKRCERNGRGVGLMHSRMQERSASDFSQMQEEEVGHQEKKITRQGGGWDAKGGRPEGHKSPADFSNQEMEKHNCTTGAKNSLCYLSSTKKKL